MTAQIQEALQQIAEQRRVRILYACESGSRAWGFESPDSDYDARFIYVHEPGWYLSIKPGRDVIEELAPGDLDLSGWDLRKALGLLRKSNPPLLEWLRSPIVYMEEPGFSESFRALADRCYSPHRCFRHYLHMAEGNMREYLKGDVVRLKKYFYVLRPILACTWIERGMGMPPVEFERLCDGVLNGQSVRDAVDDLVQKKRAAMELDQGPRVEAISSFLERELVRLQSGPKLSEPDVPIREFDEFFLKTLGLASLVSPVP